MSLDGCGACSAQLQLRFEHVIKKDIRLFIFFKLSFSLHQDGVKREVLEESGLEFLPKQLVLLESNGSCWFSITFIGEAIGGWFPMSTCIRLIMIDTVHFYHGFVVIRYHLLLHPPPNLCDWHFTVPDLNLLYPVTIRHYFTLGQEKKQFFSELVTVVYRGCFGYDFSQPEMMSVKSNFYVIMGQFSFGFRKTWPRWSLFRLFIFQQRNISLRRSESDRN